MDIALYIAGIFALTFLSLGIGTWLDREPCFDPRRYGEDE
jgi:hypothetical protein